MPPTTAYRVPESPRSRARVAGLAASLLLALSVLTRPAAAGWPADSNGQALCAAPGDQFNPRSIPDGAGGSIVAWWDQRSDGGDIYVQWLSAAGEPMWTGDGVAVCTAANFQQLPDIVSDGAGGAIVVWEDYRAGNGDIYAQRVSAAGHPEWTANGVAVCAATRDQFSPSIVADGTGGAIITWSDFRNGLDNDMYAQRLNSTGVPKWTPNGVALCTVTGDQDSESMVSDGAGGAIVAWRDYRDVGANGIDLYAQRISPTGAPQWAANGVALCTAPGTQDRVTIASDGAGGAIAAWQDDRVADRNVYAQRVNATGAVVWTPDGVPMSTTPNRHEAPTIVADGGGGAIVAWSDDRNGDDDIYAQLINSAGLLRWTPDGIAVCAYAGEQQDPVIVSDGGNGAIVAWADYRNNVGYDIYAERLNALGGSRWNPNGVVVCDATGNQRSATIVSDGAAGVILAWEDQRGGATSDIYAQRIEGYGFLGDPAPAITRAGDVPNDQGGWINLAWDASYLDAGGRIMEYQVFRSSPGSSGAQAAARRGVTWDSDVAARTGALLAQANAGVTVYWEYVGTQAAAQLGSYSMMVPTTSDSIPAGNPRTLFLVEARMDALTISPRWYSAPDSGYSVDNVAPVTPAPFTGAHAFDVTHLHWPRNTAPDLVGYRLYRGTSASFTPGPGNLLAAPSDTGYADAAAFGFVYKLTANDVHGNASAPAVLLPSGTVDVGHAPPPALMFAAPGPNPARDATTLNYALSRPGHVRLTVYDASGRRVQVLRDGELPAGERQERFALRDPAGRDLPSGFYMIRLEAEGRVLTRRLAVIR